MLVNVGKRVQVLRESRGWSQRELVRLVNASAERASTDDPERPVDVRWSISTPSKIENGERSVHADELVLLADLFGISVDALLRGDAIEADAAQAARRMARLLWEGSVAVDLRGVVETLAAPPPEDIHPREWITADTRSLIASARDALTKFDKKGKR